MSEQGTPDASPVVDTLRRSLESPSAAYTSPRRPIVYSDRYIPSRATSSRLDFSMLDQEHNLHDSPVQQDREDANPAYRNMLRQTLLGCALTQYSSICASSLLCLEAHAEHVEARACKQKLLKTRIKKLCKYCTILLLRLACDTQRGARTNRCFVTSRSPVPAAMADKPALASEALRSPVAPGNKLFRFMAGDGRGGAGLGSAPQSPFLGSPIGSDAAGLSSAAASPRRCATRIDLRGPVPEHARLPCDCCLVLVLGHAGTPLKPSRIACASGRLPLPIVRAH